MYFGKTIVFLLVLLVGGVLLQIFLSRRESRWPGLVLPVLCALYSILLVCNLMAPPDANGWQIAGMVLSALLLANIPTLVLLAIYFACRDRQKRRREMDKMNAQDLE